MKNTTKETIIKSFNQLMHEYSFDEITIQMIIKKAEISKATFYRYFKDKQDVLCSNYDQIHDKSLKSSHNMTDLMYQLALEFSQLGKRTGKAFLQYTGDNNYSQYIIQKSTGFLLDLYRDHYDIEMTADELFQCQIVLGGISHSIHLLAIDVDQKEMRHRAELVANMLPEAVTCLQW